MGDDHFDDTWIRTAAERLGVPPPSAEDVDALLDAAGHAAHDSGDRRNAPVLCFLLGRGHVGGDDDVAASVAAQLERLRAPTDA